MSELVAKVAATAKAAVVATAKASPEATPVAFAAATPKAADTEKPLQQPIQEVFQLGGHWIRPGLG